MSPYYQTKDTMVMTIERQPTAKDLFCSALEKPSQERQGFLLKACQGDNVLYKEVLF